MNPVTGILLTIIDVLWFVILGQVILSWLMVAGLRNDFVVRLYSALGAITNPLMQPLRRVIPTFGMVDITPMVVMFSLAIVRRVLYEVL